MSARIQMKSPPVPAPSRLYWICQAAGWGSFVLYTENPDRAASMVTSLSDLLR